MAKKDLRSIADTLRPAAEKLPTQNVQPLPTPKQKPQANDAMKQFSFGLRQSQRKQLARLAADDDMTMRAFILSALRDKGLDVTDEDLLDLRRSGSE